MFLCFWFNSLLRLSGSWELIYIGLSKGAYNYAVGIAVVFSTDISTSSFDISIGDVLANLRNYLFIFELSDAHRLICRLSFDGGVSFFWFYSLMREL